MCEPPQLERRLTDDGSLTFFSPLFQETFHSSVGARQEAEQKYVLPAELDRWPKGATLQVVDVGVGLGYNTAALAEAAHQRALRLQWWGLELDPSPLKQALTEPRFTSQWHPKTLDLLHQLAPNGTAATTDWHSDLGRGHLVWGDGRQRLPELLHRAAGQCDLVMLDAFSPRRCPQLWTLEFLMGLAQLLAPGGRILTYCSAAAVRHSLLKIGLQIAAIQGSTDDQPQVRSPSFWSLGTAASWQPLPHNTVMRPLSPMEWDHLTTRAAEPYRDPDQSNDALAIKELRQQAQSLSSACSTSSWRRRWGT